MFLRLCEAAQCGLVAFRLVRYKASHGAFLLGSLFDSWGLFSRMGGMAAVVEHACAVPSLAPGCWIVLMLQVCSVWETYCAGHIMHLHGWSRVLPPGGTEF
jgi:hypothetical protein